jgi:CBS domain-containing protein
MAGWIALRYLDDPATAATYFARIQDVSNHTTSLARSHYWLGRVADATHQPDQARAEYKAAAGASASYYGQLARARLGIAALALAPPPATPDKRTEAERLASTLGGVSLALSGKAGEEGKLFGSITSQDIADALARQGHTIDRRRIELEHPIKTIGEHAVTVRLHPEVHAELRVSVIAE